MILLPHFFFLDFLSLHILTLFYFVLYTLQYIFCFAFGGAIAIAFYCSSLEEGARSQLGLAVTPDADKLPTQYESTEAKIQLINCTTQ